MIRPSIILALLLLVAFIPIRPNSLWRLGSTAGVIFTLNWMNSRIEQNERLIRKMYAKMHNVSEKSVDEDFPPIGLGESSSELIKDIKPYVEPVFNGLKRIFDDNTKGSAKSNFHNFMDPTGTSTDDGDKS